MTVVVAVLRQAHQVGMFDAKFVIGPRFAGKKVFASLDTAESQRRSLTYLRDKRLTLSPSFPTIRNRNL